MYQARSHGGARGCGRPPPRLVLAPPKKTISKVVLNIIWICPYLLLTPNIQYFFWKTLIFADHSDILLYNVIPSFFVLVLTYFGVCRQLPLHKQFCTPKFYIRLRALYVHPPFFCVTCSELKIWFYLLNHMQIFLRT